MSNKYNQDFEMYQPSLAEFAAKFVPHNNVVYVYSKEWIIDDDGLGSHQWNLLLRGTDWQIAYDSDEDYFITHTEVEKCPYASYKVEHISSVYPSDRFDNNAVDEVGIVIKIDK